LSSQLYNCKIKFQLLHFRLFFTNDYTLPSTSASHAAHYKGIFFTGANSKSQTIADYLPYLTILLANEGAGFQTGALEASNEESPCLGGSAFGRGMSFANSGEFAEPLLFRHTQNSLSKLVKHSTSHIILVDDRIEHLLDVQDFCQRQQLDFTGILYRGLEQLSELPDPHVAQFQKQYLLEKAQWLEDDAALALLE
jgi:hypothetical protein